MIERLEVTALIVHLPGVCVRACFHLGRKAVTLVDYMSGSIAVRSRALSALSGQSIHAREDVIDSSVKCLAVGIERWKFHQSFDQKASPSKSFASTIDMVRYRSTGVRSRDMHKLYNCQS
jgi:hypothetical protein